MKRFSQPRVPSGYGKDGKAVTIRAVAQKLRYTKDVIRAWVAEEDTAADVVDTLIDELWAALHGMAALYLDRAAPFNLERAQECVRKLLFGTREHMQGLPNRAKTARDLHEVRNALHYR